MWSTAASKRLSTWYGWRFVEGSKEFVATMEDNLVEEG